MSAETSSNHHGGEGRDVPASLVRSRDQYPGSGRRVGIGFTPFETRTDVISRLAVEADALGLDPANATLKRFRTANSSFEAFGHEVEISVLGVTTVSTVYFFADASINKNVLGRVGWLDRVRLGLVDHDTTMYLAPYDTE